MHKNSAFFLEDLFALFATRKLCLMWNGKTKGMSKAAAKLHAHRLVVMSKFAALAEDESDICKGRWLSKNICSCNKLYGVGCALQLTRLPLRLLRSGMARKLVPQH